jgi:hypothetical protein
MRSEGEAKMKRSRMPRIRFGSWKGVVLYAKETPFTAAEKGNWEKHYGMKLKQFCAGDIDRYVLGIAPRGK